MDRRTILGAAGGLAAASLVPGTALAAPRRNRGPLLRWARDVWRSMAAMADERTGLPADNIDGELRRRSGYTSPTNIGGYLWSTLIARELKLITPGDARRRIARTLTTLAGMEHHEPSGMYVNWYDEATGEILTTWPEDGKPVTPFVSSIDAAWLGVGLHVVAAADRDNAALAQRLAERMRWDMFFDPGFGVAGANHGGFFMVQPPDRTDGSWGNHIGEGPDVWYTDHHYDTHVSETRITTYLGIARDQIPPEAYFGTWRTFPPEYDWPEMAPVGQWRTHLGVDVFEGAHTYRGMTIVPGWGGSMFEELMPDLFVPEADWGPRSWGRNHPLHVRAQREHGLDEAGYGIWGFSPSSDPFAGYREYGVDLLGLNPEGYFSDVEMTDVDGRSELTPTFGDGVATPHAAFLAMGYEPDAAIENLTRLERQFGAYGAGGHFDAVAASGRIARRYLSLDQAMIMGALGNVLLDGRLREWFAGDAVATRLRPVIESEEFATG